MPQTFSFLFYPKKPKNPSGTIFLYLRIAVAGKRAEVSTGREIDSNRWSSAANRMKGTP